MKSKLTIVLLIAAALFIGAWSSQGQTKKAKNVSFEYWVIADPTWVNGQEKGLDVLNRLGADGWEITGSVQYDGANPPRIYLKRVKQ